MTIGTTSLLSISAILLTANISLAAGGAHHGDVPPKALPPANRFSGRTPIDLRNGIPFNNGTFGAQNPDIQKWAQAPTIFPGVNDFPYPFSLRASLLRGLETNVGFVQEAIANWKTVTPLTKPETKEYGERAVAAMAPQLERLKTTVRSVSSASESDWEKAQAEALQVLIELRSTYTSLHRNTR